MRDNTITIDDLHMEIKRIAHNSKIGSREGVQETRIEGRESREGNRGTRIERRESRDENREKGIEGREKI